METIRKAESHRTITEIHLPNPAVLLPDLEAAAGLGILKFENKNWFWVVLGCIEVIADKFDFVWANGKDL